MDHILKCHPIAKADFVKAQNCYLYDAQGRQYVDFESGVWCTALGHNHPRVVRAMQEQMERVIHLGTRFPNELAEEAATHVLDVVNLSNGKCVFLSSGSEAVEFGVQVARRILKKLEFHYTPKHGSWLNMVEIELSVFGRTMKTYIHDQQAFAVEAHALTLERNTANAAVNWQFRSADARIKLKQLYPSILA